MTEPTRPNPDALLSAIQEEEAKQRRGKFKIFLGMCAGVGKTFAMLQDARQRRQEGKDVVAAIIETHKRAETEALCNDLPFIPPQEIHYREVLIQEMDLDAVLARRPEIVLVDELAHTNAPESRHPKRFQDVLELLEAGIQVYTTLNIQHVESRVDTVSQITGIQVHETVPDSVIDRADEIQLIDLTPEKLRERLSEGRVYLGEKAATTAAMNFFREENLTALREISLRLTAEHVGQNLRDVMESKQIDGPWKTNERPMVAVGPSPFSEKLIRWTRRVASALDTPWVATYVEALHPLSEAEKSRLAKNLALARQLGAKIVMTSGSNMADALLRTAREHNVTQIIIGKTSGRPWLRFILGNSLVDQLMQRSGDIDIYVIHTEKPANPRRRIASETIHSWLQELLWGTSAVSGVTLACWLIQGMIGYWTVALLFLVLVIFLATKFHRVTILWAATLSALLWDFFFIPPQLTFRIGKLHDSFMLVMYYLIALVIGQLTYKIRLQEKTARRHDQRTQALYRLAQSAVENTTLEAGLRYAMEEIASLFNARTTIMLVQENGTLAQIHPNPAWELSEKQNGVAAWAFLNNQIAGRYTDTLPDSQAIYLPLHTSKAKFGVMAVHFLERKSLALEERELLETIADQVAVMVERYHLLQQAARAQVAEESERLYKVIFDSVSHELKTPLAVITAATETLRQQQALLSSAALEITDDIQAAVIRLRRAVENLLGMSRIESGRLKLELHWCEVAELVQAAREQVADMLIQHRVRGTLGPELPLVKLDFGLMVHALSNVLANAAIYSPATSEIRISAVMDNSTLILRITDEGPGLPDSEMQKIFEKFYRGSQAKPGGSGLGLTIARALIQAHGGDITVENNLQAGATFTVRLPVTVTSLDTEGQLP